MSRRQKSGLAAAIMSVILVGLVSVPLWANTDGQKTQQVRRTPLTFEAVRRIKARYSSVLQPQRVKNDQAAHYLHVKQSLKGFTAMDLSMFGSAAGNVTFRKGWHPRQYSYEFENKAMFKLGVLAGLGHYTIVNANVPEMRENAVTLLGQIGKIFADTKLADMSGDLSQIAQAVADPSFNGGPSKTSDSYALLVTRLGDRVFDVYHNEGYWYYTAGVTLAAIHCTPGRDEFHGPYLRDMLQLLYNNRPYYDLPYAVRYEMSRILRSDYPQGNASTSPDCAFRAIKAMTK